MEVSSTGRLTKFTHTVCVSHTEHTARIRDVPYFITSIMWIPHYYLSNIVFLIISRAQLNLADHYDLRDTLAEHISANLRLLVWPSDQSGQIGWPTMRRGRVNTLECATH